MVGRRGRNAQKERGSGKRKDKGWMRGGQGVAEGQRMRWLAASRGGGDKIGVEQVREV